MRRTFTPEEDIQILEFAEEHKNDITIPWVELANTTMKNHSNAMIGQRYHQLKKKGVTLESLKPKPHPRKSPVVTTGGKRSPLEQMRKQKNNHAYTYEEECELMKLYKIYGKKYDEIAKHFPVKDVTCSAIKLKIGRLLNRRFVLKDEAPKVTYRVRDLHPPRYKPLPRSISLEVSGTYTRLVTNRFHDRFLLKSSRYQSRYQTRSSFQIKTTRKNTMMTSSRRFRHSAKISSAITS